jgi:multiple sugar transport system substrate-binding protein
MQRHFDQYRWHAARALAAALIALIAISACAGPGATPPTAQPSADTTAPASPTEGAAEPASAVTIGFAAPEFERQAYEPLIAAFNEQNPGVRVEFVALNEGPAQSFDQMMRQMVSSADTAATFFLRPEDIKNGLVRDLAPLIDADPTFDRDDFYAGALAPAGANEGIYLVPRIMHLALLSYNKDLWARRGLSAPKPDWTWNDLLAAAEQLAQKRGDTVDVYGLSDGNGGMTALAGLLVASGLDLATPAEQVRFERPEVAAALERVAALAKSGAIYVSADAENRQQPEAFLKMIADQQLAIWFGEPVIIGPDVPKPAFAVGTAPLPPSGGAGFSGTEGYIMSSGSTHPAEAWRWLSFLSRQEFSRPFMGGGSVSMVPARKSLAELSGYWKRLDQETSAAVQAALARRESPLTGFSTDRRAGEVLGQALAAVVGGKRSVSQALADAQALLDKQIAAAQATPSPTPDAAPIVVATPAASGPAPGATTISFNVPFFQSNQLRRLASEFNKQHPDLFIEVKSMQLDQKATLSKMADGADCFYWPDPASASQISGTLDLRPLVDADPELKIDDYPAALLAPFKRGTALYGLPYQFRPPALTYNQTAFDAAGLAHPNATWTADDFLNAAKQLTSGGASDSPSDKRYGYATLGAQTDDLLLFMSLFGAQPTRAGAANFTEAQVEQAARFYIDLLRNYSPHKQLQGYARSLMMDGEAFRLIDEGRVGMWFDSGGFQIVMIGPGAPGRQNYTRAIAPPPGADKATANDLQTSGLYISATSQHTEACWQWLKFLSGDLSALEGNFPARRSLAESDAFLKSAPAGAAEVYAGYRAALDRVPEASAQTGERVDLFWFFRAVDRALQGKDLGRELADAQALTERYLTYVRSGGVADACAKQTDPAYDGFAGAAEREMDVR